jgi:hypothetical protein
MTTQQLLTPRYEVIADYPFNPYQIGDLVENIADTSVFLYARINDTDHLSSNDEIFDKYPHLFRKLNWWEKRKAEDMPKRLICKAIPGDTEIMEIQEWDMDILVGWLNKKERQCCSLRSFNPEYGYFPVD